MGSGVRQRNGSEMEKAERRAIEGLANHHDHQFRGPLLGSHSDAVSFDTWNLFDFMTAAPVSAQESLCAVWMR